MEKEFKIPKTALAGGAGATVVASLPVPDGQIVRVHVAAKAHEAVAGDSAVYEVIAAVKNVAGTTTLIGSPDIVAFEDDNTWELTVQANDTTDKLEVVATPDGADETVFEGRFTVSRLSVVPA